MSVASVPQANSPSTMPSSKASAGKPARRWMINSWVDYLFILLTPLVATPAVLMLSSSWVGIQAETISLIVTAFFATGHHLPGLIRAYGDRELFQRFQARFILAPPLVFLAYFPLYTYHYDLYRLIILSWATWHGLMQLYGFVRIYDAKVGSTSPITARWDWLVCVCGFVTPQLFRPEHLSKNLGHWYLAGGPLIPLPILDGIRWALLGFSIVVLIGFTVNYVVQMYRGPAPNPLKVLMLASGIGTWCFAIFFIENLILGVALFDICHDIQYLAIVWLYNCRRVSSNTQLNGFMRYVFRRGMVLLYLGLITAYGTLAFVGQQVLDGTVSRIFYGVLFTSTILHYYYDGFIWKVRESTNQASLGLSQNPGSKNQTVATWRSSDLRARYGHLLKWSPVIFALGLLFLTDITQPTLTTDRKEQIDRDYSKRLMGSTVLPDSEEERSWLYTRFECAQQVAAAVPEDRSAQLQAIIMQANFGQYDEASARLQSLLQTHPDYLEGHKALGEIHLHRGNLDEAAESLNNALANAGTDLERSDVNLKLGHLYLLKNDLDQAREKFSEAVRVNPELAASVDALRKSTSKP